MAIKLEWAQFSKFDSMNVYRSTSSIDTENLPTPLATGLKTMYYLDSTAVDGETYYYVVGMLLDGVEKISDEIKTKAGGDLYWNDVITLLNFDNNNLTDSTGKRVWTASNAAVAPTNSVTLWGDYCLDLTGTSLSHSLYTDDSEDFNFGSGDFAIESSFRLLSKDSFHTFITQRTDNANNESFSFFYFNNNFYFDYTTDGTTVSQFITPISLDLNTKYDVQLVREGVNLKLGLNGTLLNTKNIGSVALYNSTARIVIGQLNDSLPGGYFNGYMDEIRVTKGVARPIQTKVSTFATS